MCIFLITLLTAQTQIDGIKDSICYAMIQITIPLHNLIRPTSVMVGKRTLKKSVKQSLFISQNNQNVCLQSLYLKACSYQK